MVSLRGGLFYFSVIWPIRRKNTALRNEITPNRCLANEYFKKLCRLPAPRLLAGFPTQTVFLWVSNKQLFETFFIQLKLTNVCHNICLVECVSEQVNMIMTKMWYSSWVSFWCFVYFCWLSSVPAQSIAVRKKTSLKCWNELLCIEYTL